MRRLLIYQGTVPYRSWKVPVGPSGGRVARRTIYRWWDPKTDILLDALLADAEHLTPADCGDLGDDLRDYLGRLA